MDEFKRAWDYPKAWHFGKGEDAGEYTTSDKTDPPQELTAEQKELARLCAIEMEWNDWRKGKIGVSEHLALLEENKRLKSDAANYQKVKNTLSREGFDSLEVMIAKYKTVMLAANKTSIEQEDEINALREKLKASERMARNARNELCIKCGRYHEAHNGACDGCKWANPS